MYSFKGTMVVNVSVHMGLKILLYKHLIQTAFYHSAVNSLTKKIMRYKAIYLSPR